MNSYLEHILVDVPLKLISRIQKIGIPFHEEDVQISGQPFLVPSMKPYRRHGLPMDHHEFQILLPYFLGEVHTYTAITTSKMNQISG